MPKIPLRLTINGTKIAVADYQVTQYPDGFDVEVTTPFPSAGVVVAEAIKPPKLEPGEVRTQLMAALVAGLGGKVRVPLAAMAQGRTVDILRVPHAAFYQVTAGEPTQPVTFGPSFELPGSVAEQIVTLATIHGLTLPAGAPTQDAKIAPKVANQAEPGVPTGPPRKPPPPPPPIRRVTAGDEDALVAAALSRRPSRIDSLDI